MCLRLPTLLLCVVVGTAACDNGTPIAVVTPGNPVTDTFPGTLTVNGATTYQFSSTGRGTVTATLTSVSPDTAVIGVSIGTWNGLSCQLVQVNDQTTQGAGVSAAASGVGTLCLRVYDAGKLTEPVTYSVDVSHP
jgi:hypothetical protein